MPENAAMPCLQAKGKPGVWFADVQRHGRLPCVSNTYVIRSGSDWLYDDGPIEWSESPQKEPYVASINTLQKICLAISRRNPKSPTGEWERYPNGYDSVWEIEPIEVSMKRIHFRFLRKVCNLDSGGRKHDFIQDPAGPELLKLYWPN